MYKVDTFIRWAKEQGCEHKSQDGKAFLGRTSAQGQIRFARIHELDEREGPLELNRAGFLCEQLSLNVQDFELWQLTAEFAKVEE